MRRTLLITGAAKRLGMALAKDGHRIAFHFRSSRHEAEETWQAILNAGGDAALFQNPLTAPPSPVPNLPGSFKGI